MGCSRLWRLSVIGVVLLNACATETRDTGRKSAQPARTTAAVGAMSQAEANLIKVEPALHFSSSGGADVVVPAGTYQVTAGEGTQIALIAQGQPGLPILIDGAAVTHDEKIDVTVARVITGPEDTSTVILLEPGGKGRAASGSESGVGTRGIASTLGGIKTLNAPAPIQQLHAPVGGWVKAANGVIPYDALPVGKNGFGVVYVCRGTLPQWPKNLYVGDIFPPSGMCFMASGKASNYDVLTTVWQYASNGAIPQGAYPTGGAYFTCRAFYAGGKVPGKIRQGMNGCSIGWNRLEVVVPGYEVLMMSFVVTSGTGSDFTATKDAFERTARGGLSTTDDYLCAASYQGELHPGRLNRVQNACVIGWNGREVPNSQFSILQAKLDPAVGPLALVGGKLAQSLYRPLTVCRYVTRDGTETAVGYLNPEMGTGNDPGPCELMFSDGRSARYQYQETQTIRDMYQGVAPNWDPAVK